MSEQLDWSLLDRYFGGEAAPHDVDVIQRWLVEDSGRAEELEAVRKIWEEAGTIRPRFAVQAAKAAVHRKMAEPVQAIFSISKSRFPTVVHKTRLWAIAAGIAALLVGAGVWRVAQSPPAALELAAGQAYTTARGERGEFHLPDGTRVMLGPASRLTVAVTYGMRARKVGLEGEGYFEVTHDDRRPFAVYAGGAVVRDLGTRFEVRVYPEDHGVRVVVAEGKVGLGDRALAPREMADRASDGRVVVQRDVDVERYLAWTSGYLVFEDTPLIEAIPELNRWYDLHFQLADHRLARLPLTGRLEGRLNGETLDLLALLLGVSVERHGSTVVIGGARS